MQPNIITCAQLQEKIQNGKPILLVDVRDEAKYLAGSLQVTGVQTINLPYLQMRDEQGNATQQVSTLPFDTGIITVCTTGNKAQKAALLLREQGLQAVSLEGGLTSWLATQPK